MVPNRTLCTDGVLGRVGFMSPTDVGAFVSVLESHGLVFERDGEAVDVAVVDQQSGPTTSVPWLAFGAIETPSMRIAACWLAGHGAGDVAVPDGWRYEQSLSREWCFATPQTMDDRFRFLRRQKGVDVYLDLWTGKEVLAGRPMIAGETVPALRSQLEAICHEALDIERRMQAVTDEREAAPLFQRLNDELLAAVSHITRGPGRDMALAHFANGLVLRMLARRDEAEIEFREAHHLEAADVNTIRELVRCLGEQEKHAEALPFARKAVHLAPLDGGVWANLAMCLIALREREEARRAIERAVLCDADDPINRYIYENFERYFEPP
jgi:hypothetical protein